MIVVNGIIGVLYELESNVRVINCLILLLILNNYDYQVLALKTQIKYMFTKVISLIIYS